MKRIAIALLATIVLTGCAAGTAPAASSGSAASPPSGSGTTASGKPTIDQQQRDVFMQLLLPMLSSQLQANWEGEPQSPPEDALPPVWAQELEITKIEPGDGQVTVTVELYGSPILDLASMTDSTNGMGEAVIAQGREDGRYLLPIGKSTVVFKDTAGWYTPLSCSHTSYPTPGLDYLKARTQAVSAQLAASKQLDVAAYDPVMVDIIWRKLAVTRYLPTPAGITLWDLEQIDQLVLVPWMAFPNGDPPKGFALDAELLRLMPNLRVVDVYATLKDYSVFAELNKLECLLLGGLDNAEGLQATPDLSTLAVGQTKLLVLVDPIGTIDLGRTNTEALRLESWRTAVEGFVGCERLQKLYIMGTRTDTRLINAQNFPAVRYLNLYFSSDTARYRDLSQLATFSDSTKIDLFLGYQACNDRTVESLAGVRINYLVLSPQGGAYPLPDQPKQALVNAVNAAESIWGDDMYFRERTGNE